jgi:hypothetical protein
MLFDPQLNEALQTRANVRITVRERGKLVAVREHHNVFTNTGRAWQALLYGSPDYQTGSDPTPHVQTRIKYVGFGCGGALQTDTRFARRQQELVTVTHLEDPVPFSRSSNVRRYLKELYPQQLGSSLNFPSPYRCCLVSDVLESEISFINNRTRVSNVEVGTLVPISEVGLYLSSALPFFTHPSPQNGSEADPATANEMVAYNIFEPIPITPQSGVRVEWELRT